MLGSNVGRNWLVYFRDQKQDHHLGAWYSLEYCLEVIGIRNHHWPFHSFIHSRFVPREKRTKKMNFLPEFETETFQKTTSASNDDTTHDGLPK